MENHNHLHPQTPRGELLAQGKVARADKFPCGHVVMTFETFKVGFAREDFADFANTVAMASSQITSREHERAQWGLYMD